jgi:predicted enzyme related to lactoylglutathione lyase
MATPAPTFVHMELSTGNPAKAKQFYKSLFKWKLQDVPMPNGSTYTMLSNAEGAGFGGLQGLQMKGQPSAWLGYVGVKSVKRVLSRINKLGGKVVAPYMKIPGHGAMGIFADPTGAHIAVWEAGPAPKKKAAKKKASKRVAKKVAKKKASKRVAKKKTSKRVAKKKASKRVAKKKTSKRVAKKKASKRTAKKRAAKK